MQLITLVVPLVYPYTYWYQAAKCLRQHSRVMCLFIIFIYYYGFEGLFIYPSNTGFWKQCLPLFSSGLTAHFSRKKLKTIIHVGSIKFGFKFFLNNNLTRFLKF